MQDLFYFYCFYNETFDLNNNTEMEQLPDGKCFHGLLDVSIKQITPWQNVLLEGLRLDQIFMCLCLTFGVMPVSIVNGSLV